MLMHLAVARETARGLGKKHMGPASWSTFAFYKDINMTGAQWWKVEEEEKLPWLWGEVWFGDGDGPQLVEADWGRETALYFLAFELHQWNTFNWLHCQQKTDINIFEEDMHRANGDMTVSLVSVHYQCFTKTVPLALQEGVFVFLLKSWQLQSQVVSWIKYPIKCIVWYTDKFQLFNMV